MKVMKVSGIAGFVLFVVIIGLMATLVVLSMKGIIQPISLSGTPTPPTIPAGLLIALLGATIIALIALFFYSYGFVRVGRAAESLLLAFAAKSFFLVLIAIVSITLITILSAFLLSGKTLGIILMVCYVLLAAGLSYGFLNTIIVGLGFVDTSDKVKFILFSGLSLIGGLTFALFSSLIGFGTIGVSSLSLILGSGASFFSATFFIFGILTLLLCLASILLGSLALLDASKKFENQAQSASPQGPVKPENTSSQIIVTSPSSILPMLNSARTV